MIAEHVHISHVSKLGSDIPCVNLPAGDTCRSDAPCRSLCYGRKGRFTFPHNKFLYERNLMIWNEDHGQYERDVTIAAFHSRYFRWHSSGDIPSSEYLDMMVRVAQSLSSTQFLCFTKRYEWVNNLLCKHRLPENLHIVLSAWGDWVPLNPHNLPVAYIRFKNRETHGIPSNVLECRKYCGDCVMTGCSCWDLKNGQSVVFNEH